jgi:branched-chain amino acid transport system substrate-binding protein
MRTLAAVTAALVLALSGTPVRAAAPAGPPILVGAVLSTTGPFAPLGEPEANALRLAETDINAHGGVAGRPIRVEIVDDEGKPDTAAELATQLVGKHAVAIVGGTTSTTTAAIVRVTTGANVLQVYPTPTSVFWNAKSGVVKTLFETTPRNEIEAAALADFARKTWNAKSFAILHDENQVGVVGAAVMADELGRRHLPVVENESYPTDATDVTAQLLKIKSSGADTLVLWGASPALGIIARQIKQLGLTQHVISSTGTLSDNFLKIAGPAADGIYSDSGLNFTHPSPQALAFLARYRAAYHARAVQFASFAWDALHVVALAIAQAHGKTDAVALADALESGVPYKGSTAEYVFTPKNHNGLGPNAIHMAVAKNGVWYTL